MLGLLGASSLALFISKRKGIRGSVSHTHLCLRLHGRHISGPVLQVNPRQQASPPPTSGCPNWVLGKYVLAASGCLGRAFENQQGAWSTSLEICTRYAEKDFHGVPITPTARYYTVTRQQSHQQTTQRAASFQKRKWQNSGKQKNPAKLSQANLKGSHPRKAFLTVLLS